MRVLIAVFALALALLQLKLWMSDGGLRELADLRARVEAQTAANAALAARNAVLEAEVDDLTCAVETLREENQFFQKLLEDQASRPSLPPKTP